jgi:urease gamma subunit
MKPARCKALFQPRQVVNSYSAPQRYAASGTARACRDDAVRLTVGRPLLGRLDVDAGVDEFLAEKRVECVSPSITRLLSIRG